MGVNSLPKTVTRQGRGCDLNPGPSAPESSTLTTRLPCWGKRPYMTQSFSCLHKSASPKRHLNMFSDFPQLAPVSQTNRSRYLRHVEERAILAAYRQCAPNNHRDRLDRVYPGCFDCGRFLFSQNVKFLKYFSMAFTCNAHVTYTLCLKKTRHQTLAHNFPKC